MKTTADPCPPEPSPGRRKVWCARGLLGLGAALLAASIVAARGWLAEIDAVARTRPAEAVVAGAWEEPPPPDGARCRRAWSRPGRFQGLYEGSASRGAVLAHYRAWFLSRGYAERPEGLAGGVLFLRGADRADLHFFDDSGTGSASAGCAFRLSLLRCGSPAGGTAGNAYSAR